MNSSKGENKDNGKNVQKMKTKTMKKLGKDLIEDIDKEVGGKSLHIFCKIDGFCVHKRITRRKRF